MSTKDKKVERRDFKLSGGNIVVTGTWAAEKWNNNQMDADSLHYHPLMEIGICHFGNGDLYLGDSRVNYHSGHITVIPPNFPHKTISKNGVSSFWEYIFLDVDKIIMRMYPDDLAARKSMTDAISRGATIKETSEIPEFAQLVQIAFKEQEQKGEGNMELLQGLASSIVILKSRMQITVPKKNGIKNEHISELEVSEYYSAEYDKLRPSLTYIWEHFDKDIKMSDLAAICSLSESHFRKLFVKNTAMTPLEYLNQIRIRNACLMIGQSTYPLTMVCEKCGFTNMSTFDRNFRKIIGISPSEWKKKKQLSEIKNNS